MLLARARRSVEDPKRPLTSQALADWLAVPTIAGPSVTEETAPRFIAVYRAVSLVSGSIASLPLVARRMNRNRERFRARVLERPHPDLTAYEVWERMLWALLLWGDAFALKRRDAADVVVELEPIPPSSVSVSRVPPSDRNPWGKQFTVRTTDGAVALTPWDVLHVPGPGYDGLRGLSPIGVARQAIGLGLAVEEFGARFYGQGTAAVGVLETDQPLEATAVADIRRQWTERFAGLKNAFVAPPILDSGLKYRPLGMPLEDAQFIATRVHQVEEIARLYGVPPHLLAAVEKSTSWGTGIEQQTLGLIIYTLTPWMTRIEQRVSNELLPRGVEVDFVVDGLLRGDTQARYEAHKKAIEAGWRTRAEVREIEGEPPIPGLEIPILPSSWVPLGQSPSGQAPPAPSNEGETP